jgi:hypothetical protein
MAERGPGVIPAGRVALSAKRRREWRLQAHLAAAAGSGQVGTRPSRGVSPGSSPSTVRSSPGYRSAVSGHRPVAPVTVQSSAVIVRLSPVSVRSPRLPFSRLRSSFGCLRFRSIAPVAVQSSAVSVRSPRLPFRSPRLPFRSLRLLLGCLRIRRDRLLAIHGCRAVCPVRPVCPAPGHPVASI